MRNSKTGSVLAIFGIMALGIAFLAQAEDAENVAQETRIEEAEEATAEKLTEEAKKDAAEKQTVLEEKSDSVAAIPESAPQPVEATAKVAPSLISCKAFTEMSDQRKNPSPADSVIADESILKILDSLFVSSEKQKFIRKFNSTPPVFFGAAFKTMDYPIERVTQVIKRCSTYYDIFKYVKEFQIVQASNETPVCLTAYAKIGMAFVKSWFLVNVDSISTDETGKWGMYFSKNHLPPLNQAWQKKKTPKFTYPAKEAYIQFFAKSEGESKTRVGYVVAIDSKSGVPAWIFRMVGRWVFPRFMKDIEKEIKKNLQAEADKQAQAKTTE